MHPAWQLLAQTARITDKYASLPTQPPISHYQPVSIQWTLTVYYLTAWMLYTHASHNAPSDTEKGNNPSNAEATFIQSTRLAINGIISI